MCDKCRLPSTYIMFKIKEDCRAIDSPFLIKYTVTMLIISSNLIILSNSLNDSKAILPTINYSVITKSEILNVYEYFI